MDFSTTPQIDWAEEKRKNGSLQNETQNLQTISTPSTIPPSADAEEVRTTTLNEDLWRTVFYYLDIVSLLNCEITCTDWLSIIQGGGEGRRDGYDHEDELTRIKIKKGNRDDRRPISCVWGLLYCALWRREEAKGGHCHHRNDKNFLLPSNFANSHQLKYMCRQRYVELNKTGKDVSTDATTKITKDEGGGGVNTVNNHRGLPWGEMVTQSVRFEDELSPLECSRVLDMDIRYFEVKVSGGASVGIASIDNEHLKRCYGQGSTDHVGWRGYSYGLHSDDGNVFWSNFWNRGHAPFTSNFAEFGPSTVVGCGYNILISKVFFTINGKFLGKVDNVNIPRFEYAAAISLHEFGDSAEINFGSRPFVFDIEMYCYNTRYGASK